MTVIISGGSGFIGTNLCLALSADGEDFRILDKRPSQLFPDQATRIDILDRERLAQHISGDTIIHLAAEHRDNVRPMKLYEQVNVDGTRNICRAAEMRGVNRIVFTSSVAVYGFPEPETGEDGSIGFFNEYGRTKFAAEGVLRGWQAEDPANRSLTIIRPTVVFGPGNRGNVYNLFRQIVSGHFVMVGDGKNRKSMAYIDNVVAFLRFSMNAVPGVHVYNYVDKPDLTMNELVSLVRKAVLGKGGTGWRLPYSLGLALGYVADSVARATGRDLPVSSIRVKKFVTNTVFSSRAHEASGFVAPVALDEGIARTLDAEFLTPHRDMPVFYTE